ASHHSAVPEFPGELIGTTRLIGPTVKANGIELFAINGNKATIYFLTTEGLFVSTLFHDSRQAVWDFDKAERGMSVNKAALREENFWPTITQTRDGQVWLQVLDGHLVRVEG